MLTEIVVVENYGENHRESRVESSRAWESSTDVLEKITENKGLENRRPRRNPKPFVSRATVSSPSSTRRSCCRHPARGSPPVVGHASCSGGWSRVKRRKQRMERERNRKEMRTRMKMGGKIITRGIIWLV
ncbi:hypothetical protein Dimus_013418 [Dionaea muscipula]